MLIASESQQIIDAFKQKICICRYIDTTFLLDKFCCNRRSK